MMNEHKHVLTILRSRIPPDFKSDDASMFDDYFDQDYEATLRFIQDALYDPAILWDDNTAKSFDEFDEQFRAIEDALKCLASDLAAVLLARSLQ